VSIVMGLDQHRAQITADWLVTETGEVKRARVAPADRAGVRRFSERFRGRELEVALEATTGWRFVVEELRRVGAVVDLAEPAETAGLRGPKKRAKGDRADARHLRGAVDGRAAAGVVDPARPHLGSARAGAVAAHAVWAAWRVAAADPGGLVSPRLPVAPLAAGRRAARVVGRAAAAGGRARAGDGGAGDDRRARPSARSVGHGAARVCAPPGRPRGADGPLRDRAAVRGHDPRRAR
jgi:hypothetical protein